MLVVFVAYPVLRAWRFERHQAQAFIELELGASRDSLVELAGQPTYTADRTRWVEPAHAHSKSELTQLRRGVLVLPRNCRAVHRFRRHLLYVASPGTF